MCLLDLIDRLVFFLFEKYIFIISIIRFGNIFVIFISMWIGESKGFIYICIKNVWRLNESVNVLFCVVFYFLNCFNIKLDIDIFFI